jgi:ribosomal protein L35AE/L33A
MSHTSPKTKTTQTRCSDIMRASTYLVEKMVWRDYAGGGTAPHLRQEVTKAHGETTFVTGERDRTFGGQEIGCQRCDSHQVLRQHGDEEVQERCAMLACVCV